MCALRGRALNTAGGLNAEFDRDTGWATASDISNLAFAVIGTSELKPALLKRLAYQRSSPAHSPRSRGRVSDVAVLKRDRVSIQNGRWVIFIRATKNKKPIFLPIPKEMKQALDDVPPPRGAAAGCPYYFWAGTSELKSVVGVIGECVSAVFKQSGVAKAHSHRFRHTLATDLLGHGATLEEVADVLGDSVDVVAKHYSKWSALRQARLTELLSRVHGNSDWSTAV